MGRQAIRTLVPSGLTIHSVFDSQGRRIAEYNEATGTLIREHVWMGWEPVAVIEGGQVYLVRADHIGRPAFATTLAGTKVWSAVYLPFGGAHVSVGAPIDARFPGQWFQAESGLHQNWMRDYDPTTRRYLQADPLGLVDGASVYGYALQNPGRWVDLKGENAGALAPLICAGPQAAVCAIALVCGGILAAIIANSSGEDISDCSDGACPDDDGSDIDTDTDAPRPDGIPPGFVHEGKGRSGEGDVFVNPENPKGDRIRVMPGNPESKFPAQREPYAKVTKGGRVVDANGDPITGPRPSKTPEAHIPIEKLPGVFR